jgi:hypothetical protein
LPWLLARPELIANKFDVDVDPLVLHCLQQYLQHTAAVGYAEVVYIEIK